MHKAFPLPVIEFPLAEEVPTASEESCYYQKKREATAVKIALLLKSRRNFPASAETTDTASDGTSKQKGMTIIVAIDDMQKRKNDVKARTTLLLSLPDEHQLRFKWLMHMIVWRNRSDLDTMSLDDLYNHLKVYESEVQKKSEPNPQNIAFISSAKHSRGNKDVTTASVSTASTNVPIASTNVGIDEDDMEEMNIKWNMALLSMRDVKFWKKTGKKISIQGKDVAGFDKPKVEFFNCHKMGHFPRECRAPRSQDRKKRDNYRQGSRVEEQALKALMAIDGTLKQEKEGVDGKLADLRTASKDLDNLIESQRADKNKEGLGYSDVPPPAQIYFSPKKDLSWTGLPEFTDDTITDYSRSSPTMESTSGDDQNRNPSVSETKASPSAITPKPFIKFVKASDSPTESKIDEVEKVKKSLVKYDEQYRKTNKKPNVRGNQRNWNNLKSHQLGPVFVMKKKTCFNCGDFNHLAYDCKKGPSPTMESASVDDQNKNPSVFETKASPSAITPKPFIKFVKASDSPTESKIDKAKKAKKSLVKPFQKTTQNLVAILIQRVKRLERELKARTSIQKVDRGRSRPVMAWVPKKRLLSVTITLSNKAKDLISVSSEFALMANISAKSKVFDNSLCSKDYKKNNDSLNRYNVVPPPPAQIYSSPKKDMSWTGLFEFKDDIVTNYSRPAPSVESSPDDAQNRNPSVTKTEASPSTISPKSLIKFVKENDSPTTCKTDKAKTAKKLPVKYAEQYRKPTQKPNVRGNQRNWNNLKSHQLGPNFKMKKNACFNYGNFNHLAYDSRKRVKKGTSRSQNNTHKSFTPRPAVHKPYRPPMRTIRSNMNGARTNRTSFNKHAHSYTNRPFQRTSAVKSQYRAPWVPTVNKKNSPVNRKISTVSRKFSTVNRKFPTANRKFPTGGTKFSTADIGKKGKALKPSACWFWKPSRNLSNKGPNSNSVSVMFKKYTYIDTQGRLNGCSRHMTGNIPYLSDYEPFDRGCISFGQRGCNITGKGTIKTSKLKFENMYFVKDLKYNLFSVSQICDNKNIILFTDLECIVLGQNFKQSDDDNVLLRTPRQHNMYSIDLNNIVPHKDLTCLVAKASADECILWHRRLGYLNFKTMNKLVGYNLVRGLPTKCFENDHTCIACLNGKQHKASCKSKLVNSVSKPLHTLHMDLFGPTSISSISHKWYCLVVTDDFSRFTWTFFLKTKDETSGIHRKFITEIENLKDLKVKIIRVLVNKSQNKTPYELFNGITPTIGFLKPFGCHAMILNTLDNLGKFEAKGDKVDAGTTSTNLLGTKDATNQEVKKNVSSLRYIALPNWVHDALLESYSSKPQDDCSIDVLESSGNSNPTATSTNPPADQLETLTVETPIHTVSSLVPTACFTDSLEPSSDARLISKRVAIQVETPSLENILTLTNLLGVTTNSDEPNGVEADVSNMETTITPSPIPTQRIHKDYPKSQIIGNVDTPIQTRNKSKENVWTLVDCPKGVRPIGTKWVLKSKKDERGIVIRNKAKLVAQGQTQEEGIDYDEVFIPVARIKAIRLFLAYALFMGFTMYQMDVKSAFL
nr:putative ribonuclease H-like domain-containing protein [Tanacetum cinerariifolium]